MNYKLILTFALLCVGTLLSHSQEIIRNLETNPQKSIQNPPETSKKSGEVLLLPFREDFSHRGIWPDAGLWADNDVFINSSYPINPVTIGVATFDALNHKGEIHERAIENPQHFIADILTSKPIRLDSILGNNPAALSPADSIYLSFYFQPQGLGDSPEAKDSLVLEFFIPDPENPFDEQSGQWVHIWSRAGQSFEEFYAQNQVYFKNVMIPIKDVAYFSKGFKFRFYNYASYQVGNKNPVNYAGNIDVWHLDYILLNRNRHKGDSLFNDIAFASPAVTILKNYQAMPWYQFAANPVAEVRERFVNNITNLNNIVHNYTYRYFIQDEQGINIRTYSGGSWNIEPYYQSGYQNYQAHSNPLVVNNPLPTAPAEKRNFKIVHVIKEGTVGDAYQRNDTIVFNQIFDNYYAYDDGIPEKGYGVSGINPELAYQFSLNRPDTLRAVRIFFNRTLNEQVQRPFYLKVWKTLEPELVLYQSQILFPEPEDGLNRFQTFELSGNPLVISGSFYVGIQQIGSEFMNMGFDMNNNSSSRLFYNADGNWYPSLYAGALMINPVLGKQKDNYEQPLSSEPIAEEVKPLIFPNPAREFFRIEMPDNVASQVVVSIFDSFGRQVYSEPLSDMIDIRNFAAGIYILRIVNVESNSVFTTRLVKM